MAKAPTKEPISNAETAKAKASQEYNSKKIKDLVYPENVQKRPTMYIGDVGIDGVAHNYREIKDNSLDEFMNGYATKIDVEIDTKKAELKVVDDGRGIPVDEGALERILTTLHSGGKFEEGAYSGSSGLNGVGSSVVNALSEYMKAIIKKDGFIWEQTFAAGRPTSKLIKGKATKETGTTIIFKPHAEYLMLEEIPQDQWIDTDRILASASMDSYLNRGLAMTVTVDGTKHAFFHKDGIEDYIKDNNESPIIRDAFYCYEEVDVPKPKKEDGTMKLKVEIALSYNKGSEDNTLTYCNGIWTTEGGTHLQGFRMALSTIVGNYIKDNKILTKKEADLEFDGKDFREGLIAVVSVKHPMPLYKGQTKQKLTNGDIQGVVQKAMNTYFADWMNSNPEIAKIICQKAIKAAQARKAAQSARNRVMSSSETGFASINNVAKFSDSVSKDNEESEVFVVEGDSAGGSAKQGRNVQIQAIFLLKGKPLNSNGVNINAVLDPKSKSYNKELADFVTVWGTGVAQEYDDKKRKKGKVIIMTDADVDGDHIQSLFLEFLFRWMPQAILDGRVYIAMSPLYRVKAQGDNWLYFIDDEEYDQFIESRIVSRFEIGINVNDEISVLDGKAVRKMLKACKGYPEMVRMMSDLHGVNQELMEFLILYGDQSLDTIFEVLGQMDTQDLVIKRHKTSIEIEGLYNNDYHSFFVDQNFLDTLSKATEFINANIQYSMLYVKGEKEEEYTSMYLAQALNTVYKKATPKERNRLKGLGESNPEELWETTMNPDKRRMIKVTLEDMEQATTVSEMWMGKKVESRRQFLEDNKNLIAGELDI